MEYVKGLVSVCVLSYNHGKFIEYCIESILNQIYKNIEIIVLDDGSKDNSAEIISRLKEQSPVSFNFISQENSGCIAKNCNKMIRAAKGEYITIIAADDALLPEAISKKVDIMKNDDKTLFVINSQINPIDENNREIEDFNEMPLDKIEIPTAQDVLNLDFNEIHSYYIQGSLFKRSIIDEIGGFDEDMVADDIVIRTKLSRYIISHPEYNFVTLHEPACYYRRHSSNISRIMPRQIKSVAMYLMKYHNGEKPPVLFEDWIKFATEQKPLEILKLSSEYEILKQYKRLIYKTIMKSIINNIFSVKNSDDGKHKIITVLGIKKSINRKKNK